MYVFPSWFSLSPMITIHTLYYLQHDEVWKQRILKPGFPPVASKSAAEISQLSGEAHLNADSSAKNAPKRFIPVCLFSKRIFVAYSENFVQRCLSWLKEIVVFLRSFKQYLQVCTYVYQLDQGLYKTYIISIYCIETS